MDGTILGPLMIIVFSVIPAVGFYYVAQRYIGRP